MDVKNSLLYLNTLNPSQTGQVNSAGQNQVQRTAQEQNRQTRDLVKLSPDSQQQKQNFTRGSRLVSEEIEETERGVRRTQEFENGEGKKFTRIEEINNGENRSTRTVIQQNESGNTTLLENVFDRQEDGSFRLTQRFTDETGETETNIQFGVQPPNREIALGEPSRSQPNTGNLFETARGGTLNITT